MTKNSTDNPAIIDTYRKRFHDKYSTDGPVNDPQLGRCWPWKKHDKKHRYGQFKFLAAQRGTDEHGLPLEAQRRPYEVAWELLNGPIPEGRKLKQLCGLSHCCNPTHVVDIPGKLRKPRVVQPKTDEQSAPVDNTLPEGITDDAELSAIINGEPVTSEGAAVTTPIQTTPVVQVYDNTGQRLADRPVPLPNVTSILRRDTSGYFVMAARELTVEHVHEDIEVEIDGQRRWRRIERIGLAPQSVVVFVKLGDGQYAHAMTPSAEVKLRYLDQTKLPVTGVAQ